MTFADLLRDRQPQTAAALIRFTPRFIKTVEHMGQLFLLHAAAVVSYRQPAAEQSNFDFALFR